MVIRKFLYIFMVEKRWSVAAFFLFKLKNQKNRNILKKMYICNVIKNNKKGGKSM